MGKLDQIKTAADLAKLVIDAGIAIADARRRARDEEKKREDDAKDRRITELEGELKAAKERTPA